MAIDLKKISAKKKEGLPTDPIEIFQKLKVKDSSINDLWLAQGDALREWHKERKHNDISIALNTGAGKTLVGLLIGQSLVNETREKVLYACSSIQLVDQTAEKAAGYGLEACTYVKGIYSNDLFHTAKAPCITTYQAIFNGKSVFFREEIAAIVFDDAHAAEHILRDHFCLRIEKSEFGDLYLSIRELFRPYHFRAGLAGSFEDLSNDTGQRLLFVPPFEIHRQFGELLRVLHAGGLLAQSSKTMFAWEYVKDKLDLCSMLLSPTEVTITPAFIPLDTLPYFQKRVRRVYLSATLTAEDAFIRTFGRAPKVIAPQTTAGECERLILFPCATDFCKDDVEDARALIHHRKALVLVPTYARARRWEGIAAAPDRERVTDEVNRFKASKRPTKLLLAARYDGVDLPGDTCRMMVIDDLPMGVGPLERYMWEQLGLSNTLRSSIASRIVQSFGRISRGMSDHGVVVLSGKRLIDWILVPRNAGMLPSFLQKQLSLGYEISKQAAKLSDFNVMVDKCLGRDKEWLATYNSYLEAAEAESFVADTDKLCELAKSEATFGINFWNRNYEAAAKQLASTLEGVFETSDSAGAWHCLWLGRAYELLGDTDSATDLYKRAHSVQRNIPPYTGDGAAASDVAPQVLEVERQFRINPDGTIHLPKKMDVALAPLKGAASTNQTEESVRALGQYLGITSSRPDKEHGTGPDVLWFVSKSEALCMEVKSDKAEGGQYHKDEVGQLADHVQWVRDNTDAIHIIPTFVGPIVPATPKTNPPDEFMVISLSEFSRLADQLLATFRDAASNSLPLTLRSVLAELFRERKLIWPDCLRTLNSVRLKNL